MITSKESQALQYLQDSHHAEWCAEYGEPGYSNPAKGIILANWNDVPKGLADWLELCGYELEWSDEWTIPGNGKAYRTSPDCHSWESSLLLSENGEYVTPDDGAPCWIDECALTDKGQSVRACLPSRIEPADLETEGFTLFRDRCESGFHPGQTDSPDAVAREAFEQGAYRVVFRKVENSQFYSVWQCWAEFDGPTFDRLDVCAAYARLESDYNVGGMLRERASNQRRRESCAVQLHRMRYRGAPSGDMTSNAWAIYRAAVQRMGLQA